MVATGPARVLAAALCRLRRRADIVKWRVLGNRWRADVAARRRPAAGHRTEGREDRTALSGL